MRIEININFDYIFLIALLFTIHDNIIRNAYLIVVI